MPSAEELQATVAAKGKQLGLRLEDRVDDIGATIRPDREPDRSGEHAVASLLDLVEITAAADREKLDLLGTLGEGGMGVIRLGTQKVLGREVAIKTLKEGWRSEAWTLKLLREAWVTGGLEHPNVAPVYDIAIGADRTPLVVLKKIEGDDWASLIDDAEGVRERFGADDLLEWNLSVLMQVCNAVRFAHSRGIVHRDIKPENVRLGTFGEVYLLDWGIAVALEDDGSGRLPLVSHTPGLAGTPAYMAPEMLGGDGDHISERTDVYLLGAVLYRIATGHPPHRFKQWSELLLSICNDEPDVPDDVPTELAQIIRRAMRRVAEERYPDADALRRDVARFLRHRGATQLAERAMDRLGELTRLSVVPATDDPASERHDALYRLFAECRFAFQHALDVWPENERARAGLEQAIVHMVEYELEQGHPRAARALLGELEPIPEALAARVAEAERAREEEDAALRQLRDDADMDAGRVGRALIAVLMATGFVVAPLYSYLRHFVWHHPVDPWFGLGATSMLLGALSVLFVVMRGTLMRTRVNRHLGIAAFVAVLASVLAHAATILGGYDMWEPLHASHLVWATITAHVALTVDRRLFAAPIAFVTGYLVVAAIGRENVLLSVAATNAVLLLDVAVIWARPRRARRVGASRGD